MLEKNEGGGGGGLVYNNALDWNAGAPGSSVGRASDPRSRGPRIKTRTGHWWWGGTSSNQPYPKDARFWTTKNLETNTDNRCQVLNNQTLQLKINRVLEDSPKFAYICPIQKKNV